MKITFLIGNGFDRAAGFATSYREFYEDFLPKAKPEGLGERLICASIREDQAAGKEYWSNFEAGLGKFTEKFEPREFPQTLRTYHMHHLAARFIPSDEFFRGRNFAEEHLCEYLRKIDNDMKKWKLSQMGLSGMCKWICKLYAYFNDAESRTLLEQQLKNCEDEDWEACFISFNYTSLLDQSLQQLQQNSKNFPFHRKGNKQFIINTDVQHVHGTLGDGITGTVVLGVGDISQIGGGSFQTDVYLRRLIKECLVEDARRNWYKTGLKMIDESRIVCIYGHSLGDTDIIWWKKIGEWLNKSSDNQLVIFSFTPRPTATLDAENKLCQETLESFCQKSGISGPIKNRIHVKPLSKLVSPSWFEKK